MGRLSHIAARRQCCDRVKRVLFSRTTPIDLRVTSPPTSFRLKEDPEPVSSPNSDDHPPPPPSPQSALPLLDLPEELIIYIAGFLDTSSEACFALACTASHKILYQPAVHSGDRWIAFLKLLEKDATFGRQLWYCHVCKGLHRFEKWWSPQRSRNEPWTWHEAMNLSQEVDCRKHSNWRLPLIRDGSHVEMRWHHARLVMNQYFNGPQCGLPISVLFASVPAHSIRPHLAVEHSTSARIISGELFLERRIVLFPELASTSWDDFWMAVEMSDIHICHHNRTRCTRQMRGNRWRQIPALELVKERPVARSPGGRVSHCNFWHRTSADNNTGVAVKSCHHCSTDYTIRQVYDPKRLILPLMNGSQPTRSKCNVLQRLVPQQVENSQSIRRWYVAFQTWHQVGACQEADDGNYLGLISERDATSRNWTMHPGGIVRDRWLTAEPSV